ncbi:hypothetical protein GDO81_019064 [Engystomops pustulosus]|uniref:Uncharacterized protein n=1 Tax=Engystomops pustulosus TaxID=76066 RepID=A0AAV6ZBH8_ENGPU|nr:hypothetical protein GDO81_019064 [Engystomops pustulosus]
MRRVSESLCPPITETIWCTLCVTSDGDSPDFTEFLVKFRKHSNCETIGDLTNYSQAWDEQLATFYSMAWWMLFMECCRK